MTLKEAAELLGVTPGMLRTQIGRGRFRAERHGRDWWVTPAEVDRYRRDSLGQAHRPAGAKDRRPRTRAQSPT